MILSRSLPCQTDSEAWPRPKWLWVELNPGPLRCCSRSLPLSHSSVGILLAVHRSLVLNYVLIACLWISLQSAPVYPAPAEAGYPINQGIKHCLTMRDVSVHCSVIVLSLPKVPVFVSATKLTPASDPGYVYRLL